MRGDIKRLFLGGLLTLLLAQLLYGALTEYGFEAIRPSGAFAR